MQTFTCGQCHFECNHGVHVCRGCGGDVVYGATRAERKQGALLGGLVGLMVGAWALQKLSIVIGQNGLAAVVIFMAIGAAVGAHVAHRAKATTIRTFRTRRVS